MAAVVIKGWQKIVTVCAFPVPRPMVVGRFIGNNTISGQRKGSLIEVERAVKVVVGVDFRVGAGLALNI